MELELGLAVRMIAAAIAQGQAKEAVLPKVAKFLETQGFGAEHARKTAEKAASLV